MITVRSRNFDARHTIEHRAESEAAPKTLCGVPTAFMEPVTFDIEPAIYGCADCANREQEL